MLLCSSFAKSHRTKTEGAAGFVFPLILHFILPLTDVNRRAFHRSLDLTTTFGTGKSFSSMKEATHFSGDVFQYCKFKGLGMFQRRRSGKSCLSSQASCEQPFFKFSRCKGLLNFKQCVSCKRLDKSCTVESTYVTSVSGMDELRLSRSHAQAKVNISIHVRVYHLQYA